MLFTSRLGSWHPWARGLEPPRVRQERAKRLESGVKSARGPLSEPTRAAKGLESARRPLFEPPRSRLPRDSSPLEPSPDWARAGSGSRHPRARVWLESARLVHNTICYNCHDLNMLYPSPPHAPIPIQHVIIFNITANSRDKCSIRALGTVYFSDTITDVPLHNWGISTVSW